MGLPEFWVSGIQQWADSNSCIREVWPFGSRARGDHEDSSDVDLAVTLTPPTGLPGRTPLTGPCSNLGIGRPEGRGRRSLNGLWIARLT